jgi:tyrosinase
VAPFTRRTFVGGAAIIPFALWLERSGWAQAPPLVRFDATSPQGKAMLKIYAGAVQQMRTAPAFVEGNPRSWTFQWYTHAVRAGTNKTDELARIYPAPSVWKSLATEMWNTCQSHFGQPENYFLPWHRMFVFYFESIIRKVSGNATFTLPYWNYSVPKPDPSHGVIPPEFRVEADPIFGPLYVCKRNPGVNSGTPIDQGQPGNPLSTVALQQCTYGPSGSQAGFCSTLDGGLHGTVHVLTGNGQNMGSIPWAAYDPIFWLHHCNIDRLWASWNAAGRKNPTDATFLNQKFVFADQNGIKVIATISNFLSIAALNYKYDKLEPVTNLCPQLSPAAAAPRKLVTQATPIPLGPGPVRATLAAPPSPQATVSLATRIENLPADHRLLVVVRNLKTDVEPEVLYHIYLELPAGAPGDAGKDYYVGSINFFGRNHSHEGSGGDDKFYSFDITDLAKRLKAKGLLTDKAELTIAPAGTPVAEAKPVIGEVSIVEQ